MIDTENLIVAVEVALKELETKLPVVADSDQISSATQEAILEHKLSEEIRSELGKLEEFAQPLMINRLSGATGFQPQLVAPKLLREARRRRSAAAAIEWLQKVLVTRRAEGVLVATFWGLSPESKIVLLPDVDLMPFDLLLSSRQKQALSESRYEIGHRMPVPVFAWQAPTAALVRSFEIEPFIETLPIESKDPVDHTALIDDIQLCLATAGPTGVIPGPRWFQYTDPDLESAVLGAGTSFPHQEITPSALDDSSEFEPDRAIALLHHFVKLETALKNKARIAMRRLSQAMVRRLAADKALELAIALEALLVDQPGEHTFKIGLRAALLTSTDFEQRKRNRAIVEGMYKVRSSLLHSGKSMEDCRIRRYGRLPVDKVISEAIEITASVIQTIIAMGSIPDWGCIELSIPQKE